MFGKAICFLSFNLVLAVVAMELEKIKQDDVDLEGVQNTEGDREAKNWFPWTSKGLIDLPANCTWSKWGECSQECGIGVQRRTIEVDGQNCKGDDTKSCEIKKCPTAVDCVVSDWSECSKACGPGTQRRSVQTHANVVGKKCPTQLARSCNLKECPVDCVLSDWTECSSKTCGPGTQQRSVITQEKYGGKQCEERAKECFKECPVDCVVSDWSECSKNCGAGIQQRSVLIEVKHEGKQCPTQLTKSCNLKACEE